ncbi:LOB domain-containing protein [Striga asiatica]|uniref:LOB domain-containing protein n=1 Tax=Striga asiatica TaxID=4170 RepID=A0A5A7R7R4_STRAF|nr:LOB domain-containing protein [Striga asiatica]
MSCNGCRVLRKGCSETCILRPCLQWIESTQAQGHATVFVAKFFGRAGLMSFISAVPENQRPALFQSLLFEAAGRTVNPVSGAVGLLWAGNWRICQAAVETVLRGGKLRPIPDLVGGPSPEMDDASDCTGAFRPRDSALPRHKRRREADQPAGGTYLDLSLTPGFTRKKNRGTVSDYAGQLGSPSMNSEESLTTTCGDLPAGEIRLLNLFG